MKKMRKALALLLVAAMAMSLFCVAAFADDAAAATTHNLTIAGVAGHTYTIYQMLTGDVSGLTDGTGTLANIKLGDNNSAADVDTFLKGIKSGDDFLTDVALGDAAKKFVTGDGTVKAAETSGNIVVAVEDGYYIVTDAWTDKSVEGDALSTYMVAVVGDTTMTPKADAPEVEKKIVEGESKVDTNEASIGDEVSYEISATLPSTLDSYNSYYVKIADTMSKGLTYKADSLKVTLDGVDITDYVYDHVGDYSSENGTAISVVISDVFALDGITGVVANADDKIIVTYTATLNEHAVIAGEGNPNTVVMDYSNNPEDSGNGSGRPDNPDTPPTTPPDKPDDNGNEPKPTHPTGETPKDTVKTYTTELTILKTDEENKVLTGAEFSLTGAGVDVIVTTTNAFAEDATGTYYLLKDGTYTETKPDDTNKDDYADTAKTYKATTTTTVTGKDQSVTDVKAYVGEDGKLTFSGLGAGDYVLTETTTPEGYNTITAISFKVTFAAADATFAADNVTLEADNTLATTVVNKKGTTLPSTGGMGTTLFYVFGAILVLGAGVVLIAKKRMADR